MVTNKLPLWTKVHYNMLRKIFIFIVKYMNNTVASKKNLCKWSLSNTSAFSFCFQFETLQHVVSSCNSHLKDGRYTWHHNSVLLHIAKTLSSAVHSSLCTGLPIFPSQSLITGYSLRPDLVLVLNNTSAYVLELPVGFENSIKIDSECKAAKYHNLIANLQSSFSTVKFVDLSMSSLGILRTSSESVLSMLTDLNFEEKTRKYTLLKSMIIGIRCTYYIFCRINKNWTNPELLNLFHCKI